MSTNECMPVGCCAIIPKIIDSKIFIPMVLRGKNCRNNWGNWQLPGGGVNRNERPIDAVCREVLEEVNLKIDPMYIIPIYILDCDDQYWLNITFVCRCKDDTLRNNEPHKFDDVKWIDINNLPLNIVDSTRQMILDYQMNNLIIGGVPILKGKG